MGTHKEHKHHSKRHSSAHKHSKHHSRSGSKHKHHHSHKKKHHHHHHHKKKSHHKRDELIELQLEDKVLQNALDCLEAGALGIIQNGDTLTSDALSALAKDAITGAKTLRGAGKGEGGSEDSDADSSDSNDQEEEEEEEGGGGASKDQEEEEEEKGGGGASKDRESSTLKGKEEEVVDTKMSLAKVKEARSSPTGPSTARGHDKGGMAKGSGLTVTKIETQVTKSAGNIDNVADSQTVRREMVKVKGEVIGVDTASKSSISLTMEAIRGKSKPRISSSSELTPAEVGEKRPADPKASDLSSSHGSSMITGSQAKEQQAETKSDPPKTISDGKEKKQAESKLPSASASIPSDSAAGEKAKKESNGSSSKATSHDSAVLDNKTEGKILAKKFEIGYSSTDDEDSTSDSDSSSSSEDDDTRGGNKKKKPVTSSVKKFGQKSTIKININADTVAKMDEVVEEKSSSKSEMMKSEVSKVMYVNLKPVGGASTGYGSAWTKVEGGGAESSSSQRKSGDSKGKKKNDKSKSESGSGGNRSRSSRQSRSRSGSKDRSSRKQRQSSKSQYGGRPRSRSRSRLRSDSHSRRRRRSSSRDRIRRKRSHSPYSRSRPSRRRRRSSRGRSRTRSTSSSSRSSSSRSRSPASKRHHRDPKPSEAATSVTRDSKKETISKLTDFCKDLQKKQAVEEELGPEAVLEYAEQSYRTPFVLSSSSNQPSLVYHNNAWKTANQMVAETNMLAEARPLTDQFPVSTGLEHKTSGAEEADVGGATGDGSGNVFTRQPVDISDVAIKRVLAAERLKVNPADIEAISMLIDVEKKTKVWAESKIVPGKFTGQQQLTALTKQDHKSGLQAWAKKNMFRDLAPVMSGFGMKMMQKMGWSIGQPLGKEGVGHVEPIPVDVKMDRTGLTTEMDKLNAIVNPLPTPPPQGSQQQPTVLAAPLLQSADARSAHLVQGKHPVSALQEICNKKRWNSPNYSLILCDGPAHLKTFLYEVTIPLGTFRAANASKSKKQAKMEAATAALQGMGLLKKSAT